MKVEVVANLSVKPESRRLSFRAPSGEYECHLQNAEPDPSGGPALLHAYLVFQAPTIEEALDQGDDHARRFFQLLSFAAAARFRIVRRLAIYDWEPAVTERDGLVFQAFPDPRLPLPLLDEGLFHNLESLAPFLSDEPVLRATRWFSEGTAAHHQDFQFLFFWFAIEVIAAYTRNPGKVPDKCPKCGTAFHCKECDETPTHRPYPTQAIQQLFRRHVSNDPDRAYLACSAMRHAMLHGRRINAVEKEHEITIVQLADLAGHIARAALLSVFSKQREKDGHDEAIALLKPDTYVHHELALKAHASFESPSDREVDFDDAPILQAELKPVEGREENDEEE